MVTINTDSAATNIGTTWISSSASNTLPFHSLCWRLYEDIIIEKDVEELINKLYAEEYRKDKFRNVLMIPKQIKKYGEGPIMIHRPAKRNIRGIEARML